jgi:hypothetical protein
MQKIRVHWCYINNFGDALNPYIIEKLSGLKLKYCNYTKPDFNSELKLLIKSILKREMYDFNRMMPPDRKHSVVLGIGSLLNRSKVNYQIWGSGYMNNFEKAEGGKLFAVRGRYSAEKLQNEGFPFCKIWGDPALLLPLIYPQDTLNSHPLCNLGIIPHIKDYTYFNQNYADKAAIINLQTNHIEDVIRQICNCKFILSTSLHGIITAHAYGIPSLWIQHNNIDTDGIKFYDYFSSVGIDRYDGFRDYKAAIDRPSDFFNKYKHIAIPQINIKKICVDLLKVAPFPVLEKYKQNCTL